MSNHAHRRAARQPRTVVRPRNLTRVAPGKLLPVIPRAIRVWGGILFRCPTCRHLSWTERAYRRHHVCNHIYRELIF